MIETGVKWIKKLTDLISKKGIKNVLVAVFIVVVLYFINYVLIYRQIPFFKEAIKNEMKTEHVQEINRSIANSVNSDIKVNELLKELLHSLEGDRVYITLYHNGGTFTNGIPFIKATIIFEAVSLGTLPYISYYQQLPISMYACYNKSILSKSLMKITDIEKFQLEDVSTYEMLKNKQVKSIYVIGLYEDRIPIGFLGIEYCREKRDLDSVDVEILSRSSLYISKLLSSSYILR